MNGCRWSQTYVGWELEKFILLARSVLMSGPSFLPAPFVIIIVHTTSHGHEPRSHGGEMVRSTPNKDEGDDHNFKFLSDGVQLSR